MQPFDFLILILIIASSIALLVVFRTLMLSYFGVHARGAKQDQPLSPVPESNDRVEQNSNISS